MAGTQGGHGPAPGWRTPTEAPVGRRWGPGLSLGTEPRAVRERPGGEVGGEQPGAAQGGAARCRLSRWGPRSARLTTLSGSEHRSRKAPREADCGAKCAESSPRTPSLGLPDPPPPSASVKIRRLHPLTGPGAARELSRGCRKPTIAQPARPQITARRAAGSPRSQPCSSPQPLMQTPTPTVHGGSWPQRDPGAFIRLSTGGRSARVRARRASPPPAVDGTRGALTPQRPV